MDVQAIKDFFILTGNTVIRYAIVLSIAGTGASLINNIVYFGWVDLPYSAVATASDILIGGIQAAFIIGPIFVVFLVCSILGRNLAREFPKGEPIFAGLATLFIFVSLFLSTSAQEISLGIPKFHLTKFVAIDLLLSWSIVVIFSVAAMLIKYHKTFVFAICALSVLVVLESYRYYAQHGTSNLLVVGSSVRCGGQEYIFWVGSSYVVTSCDKPPFMEGRRYFIIKREDVQIQVDPSKGGVA